MEQTSQISGSENLSSHERILDAAELEFSQSGFDGSAMKKIALTAGVAQGLLHYHFGNKDGLYEAVVARRSTIISAAREAYLDAVDLSAPDALDRIFEALFRPALDQEGGGQAYAVIFTGLTTGSEYSKNLVRKYYDPTARRFISAINTAEPQASPDAVAWSYTLAIGSLVTTIGQSERPSRLAGSGGEAIDSIDELIAPLVVNSVGGLRALIKNGAKLGKT